MLGGFKWHSNGEGEGDASWPASPEGPIVLLEGHRGTITSPHLPPWALHLLAEVWGATPVPGLDLDLTPTFFSPLRWRPFKPWASSLMSSQ